MVYKRAKAQAYLHTEDTSKLYCNRILTTMLALHQKAMFYIMITIMTTMVQGQLPVKISPVTIAGNNGECPSDDSRQATRNLLGNATREIIQNLNSLTDPISQICGPGEWRRVFYLNASRSDQSCPGQWNLVTSPVRGCAGVDYSCRSAFSDSINTVYSKVCGRIIGEAIATVDAFHLRTHPITIEGNYLDGVSVTHGAQGSRTHIWSFAAAGGGGSFCPCSNSGSLVLSPPVEVGDNYFCDRPDRVWTGKSCTDDFPCCSFNNPPYFRVQLPSPTTDNIELRICSDQEREDELVLVLLAELYVQ